MMTHAGKGTNGNTKKFRRQSLYIAVVAALAVSPVSALQPAMVDMGPFKVVPQLSVNTGYDDNLFLTENQEKESWVTILTPSVQFIAQDGPNKYTVSYALAKGVYHDSTDDNFLDHNLAAEANLEFNGRNALDVRAGFVRGHESRGTGLNQGNNALFNPKPVKYEERSLDARYTYGAEDAQGRVELAAGYDNREYVSFREQNAARDRATGQVGATFYYRVAPKTQALFEIRRKRVDYDLISSPLDSTETTYLAGATWEATAKTTGSVKIGQTDKDFERSTVEGNNDVHWEVSLDWSPRTYSTVSLVTSKKPEETDSNGTYIDRTGLRLSWEHEWTSFVSSEIAVARLNSDYFGSTREDDEDAFTVRLNYNMRRWLDLGLNYAYSDRDSNFSGLIYDKNTIYLSVDVAL